MSDLKPDPGVFLVKGDTVSVPSLTLSVNEQGEVEASPIYLNVGIDMTAYWLDIAYKHLLATESAHKKLMVAKEEKDNEKIARYLKKESIAGMQSIMAASIALDAYYSSIKQHVDIPQETINIWRENGTARYKQISEVFRMGFRLKPPSSKSLREILKQNFRFRDKAVHPSPGTAAPLLHVELNKVTDWRYATFRFNNAKAIYGLSLSIVLKTSTKPDSKIADSLKAFCEKLIPRIKPLERKWNKRFGDLL
ncbi:MULTISPECIES: hypothetical protein [unclassified Methylophaga]|uniref:hypothetical protein n=2 Tax=Methylophaga TaxID=40222 RepID=UPI000C8CA27C|nr:MULTISPECIES: hypothetical protein [unclassified Methylophaga]MAK67665.1 hypothetical protein [Methylophaga sp.]MAY18899.1 hypothetical protein [Methylophaga sp.]HAO24449.1 hypothetical protein [Methylophaga sp.]HCD03743.1 hypothetical protein [Methylophaga sp.]